VPFLIFGTTNNMQSSRNLQLSRCATFKSNPRLNFGQKIFKAILLCHFFNAKNWRRFFMPNDLFETVSCAPAQIPRRQRGDEIRLWLLG
jgi:hypothetical protein